MMQHKERFNFRRPEIINKTHKTKEKVRFNLKPLKGLFYAVVLAFIIYGVFFSSIFKISQVNIEGVKSVEISDYMKRELMGRNILFLRTGKFLRTLQKEYPVLSEVTIIRGIPRTVKLSIIERDQIMIWCNIENCYEVDNQGYAYQTIARPSSKIVLNDDKNQVIKEGDRVASESFIYFFLKTIEELDKVGIKVTSAKMEETTFKITFITSEGWSIIADSSYSINNQVSAVRQVVDKNKADIHEYVDVRVEGLAYLK